MLTLIAQLPLRPHFQPSDSHHTTIRQCTAQDCEQLAALYFEAYDPGEACGSLEEARDDIVATFQGEYGELFPGASLVCEDSSETLCAAILTVKLAPWEDTPQYPFIIELFTARGSRRRGLAKQLMVAASRALVEDHQSHVALRVTKTNTAAAALYRSLGFIDWNSSEHEHPS